MKTTYQNKPELKELFVKETEKHRKQDDFIKGTYHKEGTDFKGCAVGCAIHSLNTLLKKEHDTDDHSVLEEESMYPEWLARLQDTLFEGQSDDKAMGWPVRFAKAIPVGVSFEDLEIVKWKFCAYLMEENIKQVKKLDNISDELKKEVINSIEGVLKVHEDAAIKGEFDESAARSAARSAAWSAARSAARSAAWSAAWSARSAAWSAARSAESAARSARSAARSARSAESAARSARSASESAAWSAESAACDKHANKLIKLLEGVKK